MLINNQPLKSAIPPLAGSGASAFPCDGVVAAHALRRPPWVSARSASSAPAVGGYVPTQFEQQMTLINPVAPGGLGPHPVREPEPV